MISLMVYRNVECKKEELTHQYYNPDYIIRIWQSKMQPRLVCMDVLFGRDVRTIYVEGTIEYISGQIECSRRNI